ncbi:MAG TPA: hypothetical protein VG755_08200 [Nannocystaceae bacterium]|nr:hypothetical protein [Nannocystaceae bacterium]
MDYVVGVYGPIVAVVWRGAVTQSAVHEVGDVLVHTARRSPTPIAFLTVAQFKAPVPSAEVRESIVRCYRSLGSQLACVAQVVEGEGFWAAAARSFIAGIGLVSRRQWPMSVFAKVPDALVWIAPHVQLRVDRPTLAAHIDVLREAL